MNKTTGMPAPDDLTGWKKVSSDAIRVCIESTHYMNRFTSDRAFVRFFDHDDFEGIIEGPEAQGIIPTYNTWLYYEYRPTAASHTIAEMVIPDAPPAVATLLQARAQAYPSIYRVTSVDPKSGFIGLEDVLQGGTVTIHDKMLSGCAEVGFCIPMSVFPAGDFWLADMAGPALGPFQVGSAIDFLRENGMEFTPQGQKRDAHLFGWLWEWREEELDRPLPKLANMDGEELEYQTASFKVGDVQKVRDALRRRDDIREEDDGTFDWFTTSGPAAKQMGGNVSLGGIELIGDELILTTNSQERLATARKWLEAIPDVRFSGVRSRDLLRESENEQPMDERMSSSEEVEMTPALADELQQFMTQRYMDWLDQSLPMLNGKTPRQMCQTPQGRHRVAIMIRTMPVPAGPVPIEVPREAMLRELGLDSATPTPGSGSFARAARNEPCPCGSGRKYKNCCGKQS